MYPSGEVLIDVTRLVGRLLAGRIPTGVDRVSLEYIRHFYNNAQAIVRYKSRWIELSSVDSHSVFNALLGNTKPSKWLIRLLITRAWWLNFIPRHRKPRFFFEIGHHGLEQPDYLKQLTKLALRPLFFVHDLIPIIHPEYCIAGEDKKHCAKMNTVLKLGQGVVVNSKATLADLTAYAHQTQQNMPPIIVARLAAAIIPKPNELPLVVGQYFVILGTIEPRKNHLMLLQVWLRLIEKLGSSAPKLIIIGQRGWECENVVDLLDRSKVLHEFVIERPACSDADLATYLYHANALLFPSFIEGYGLPLVEALALGTPVIASNLDVFHEISGEIPEYLDPLDGLAWLEKIEAYMLPNNIERLAQLDRIKTFKPPTWAEHFATVDQHLHHISMSTPRQ